MQFQQSIYLSKSNELPKGCEVGAVEEKKEEEVKKEEEEEDDDGMD